MIIAAVVLGVVVVGVVAQNFLADPKVGKGKGRGGQKGKGKGKKGKGMGAPPPWKGKGKAAVEEPPAPKKTHMVKLMAAIKAHRLFFQFKVRKGLFKFPWRTPKPKQKVAFIITVDHAKGLPHVNTFGGIDPLCQIRVAKGKDPSNTPGLDFEALGAVATKTLEGTADPKWRETLEVVDLANKEDHFLHFTIWDYNLTGNILVCDKCLKASEVLKTLDFDARRGELDQLPASKQVFSDMNFIYNPKKILRAELHAKIAYVEFNSFKIELLKASGLPKTDLMTSIDSIIEVRLVRFDPAKDAFEKNPDATKMVWSNKTVPIKDNQNPEYNKTFELQASAHPTYAFELVLFASKAPLPDAPIAHCILRMPQVLQEVKGQAAEHKMMLEKIPGVDDANDISASELHFKISYEQLFEK